MPYYLYNAGGWNKTHGQVEQTPRIDSFEIYGASPYKWTWVLFGNKCLECYVDTDFIIPSIPSREEYEISLSRKKNGFGGEQLFFLCPKCGTRCRYLYFNSAHRSLFSCRKCCKLNYKSQQQTRDSMTDYHKGMEYARRHLRREPFTITGFDFPEYLPDKPKWMRQATYKRHLARFLRYRERYSQRLLMDLWRITKGLTRRT